MSGPLYQWADLSANRAPLTVAQGGTAAVPSASMVASPGTGLINSPGGDPGASTSDAVSSGAVNGGQVGTALGVAGALTGNADLSMAGGVIGAGTAAAAGHYGGVGSMAGRALTGSSWGGLVGGLAGRAVSNDPITGKTVGSALLGMSVPGFSAVDALTGGWASDTLMGKDASFDTKTGAINSRTEGLFGAFGSETPAGTLEGATARAALGTNDPLGAFAGSMSSQQDTRDMQAAQEGFTGSEHAADAAANGPSGGMAGADGNTGSAAEGGGGPDGPSGGGDKGGGDSGGNGHGGEGGNGGW